MSIFSRLHAAVRGILHLITRPVRQAAGTGGIVIQAYRGFGSGQEVYLEGRVFNQAASERVGKSAWNELQDLWRRLMRTGRPGVLVNARFYGAEGGFVTDSTGFFRVHLRLPAAPPLDRRWHMMELEIKPDENGGPKAKTEAEVFLPHTGSRYIVISDIDDTVMYTGVANKFIMLKNLFFRPAASRVAFPGVAAFYRALHAGKSGKEANPMLYVSRAPWSIYGMLDAFFHMHRIPVGPVLFLRDWGMTPKRPFPRQAKGHKLQLIRRMLEVYQGLPFILIGDSGQHDPDIYASIVRENPGRILAIYIRNVSRDQPRIREINELAEEIAAAGSSLLLAADTEAMAEHAAKKGWIAGWERQEVRAGRRELDEDAAGPTREVTGESVAETRRAVAEGAVEKALQEENGEDTAANVMVEPQNKRDQSGGR